MSANNAQLNNLTVKGTANFSDSCIINVNGAMTITGSKLNSDDKTALTLIGDTYIQGNLNMSTGSKGNILGSNDSYISFGSDGAKKYGIWFYGGVYFDASVAFWGDFLVKGHTLENYITNTMSGSISSLNKEISSINSSISSLEAKIDKLDTGK
jgi:hypothetical protein